MDQRSTSGSDLEGEPPSRLGARTQPPEAWDAVVVGSGFGGAMAALELVDAGARVLMLERGDWVRRGDRNRDLTLSWGDRDAYSTRTPYRTSGETRRSLGSFHCVGGASVFFGGATLRFRPQDLSGDPEVTGGVRWPFGYDTLQPWYRKAERLLGVSGDTREDPTRPPRQVPLPPPGMAISPTSAALRDAARRLGLHPFRLPVALNDDGSRPGGRCVQCGTCDGFACFTGAKNDLATVLLPHLVERGMELRTGTVAVDLHTRGRRVTAVETVDRESGERRRVPARGVVVAAGALGTPHLLLTAGLHGLSPAGDQVGRNLMRHCNAVVAGPVTPPVGEPGDFRKQVAIHDFYFGDSAADEPRGKLGAIQQVRATRVGLAELPLPAPLVRGLQPLVDRSLALLVLAEDQPRPFNRLRVERGRSDAFGRPRAVVHHEYGERDRAARAALVRRARSLLRETGAPFTVTKSLTTFSHAMGTVRMGRDPARFPVTPDGRFRGLGNLWISDASVFPTAGAVNPSLTVSANALRIGRAAATVLSPGGTGRERAREALAPRPHRAEATTS